jgi:hypothetical protein
MSNEPTVCQLQVIFLFVYVDNILVSVCVCVGGGGATISLAHCISKMKNFIYICILHRTVLTVHRKE